MSGGRIEPWVQNIIGDYWAPSLRVGETYVHPEDGVIKIVSGEFWGNHGVSNFWYWDVVATGERKHGYGGNWPEA